MRFDGDVRTGNDADDDGEDESYSLDMTGVNHIHPGQSLSLCGSRT